MGFRDLISALTGNGPAVAPNGVPVEYRVYGEELEGVLGMSPERLWRTQPNLRTVVSFMARNVAQLGLHTFERVSDDDRRRVRGGPIASLLKNPNESMTGYELINTLVSDLGLYDEAYWWITEDADRESGWRIDPIPPSWVINRIGGNAFTGPASYDVRTSTNKKAQRIPASEMLVFHGWNPGAPARGASPVEALREILAEQIQAYRFREQMWRRGGRVGTVLERPKDAPTWSPDARSKFAKDWQSQWAGNGSKAGGTPILEDGMKLSRVGFSAREEDWVEAAKLSLSTCASVYHLNPTMVGVLDNANYSNVREFRRMLYGDSLGPVLAMIEDRINTFLLPRLNAAPTEYVEFNLDEKLQGSFEEQNQAMQSAIGAPWMTRNEGRALRNMPAIDGGDELVTPLNVLIGGQASPVDGQTADGGSLPAGVMGDEIKKLVDAAAALIRSGFDPAGALEAVGLDPIAHLGLLPVTVQRPQEPENVDQDAVDALKSRRFKARAPQSYDTKAQEVLTKFFRRQKAVVLSALGAKADADWWDVKRWDKELTDDLLRLAVATTTKVAADTLGALGVDPGTYDEARTLAFLNEVAKSRASMINATTKDQLDNALSSDDEEVTPAHVFDVAESDRAVSGSAALVTTFSAFATTEAAKQVAGDRATKTWIVTSSKPRAEHAAMNGETVGINETFSNGANWPGDPVLGADGVAGCQCDVEIDIP